MKTLILATLDKAGDALIKLVLVLTTVYGIGAFIGIPVVIYVMPGGPLALKIAVPIIYSVTALIGFRLYRIMSEE